MCSLRWDDRPCSDHTGRMQITVFRVPRSGKVHATLLGPVRGIWTHYVRKRTYPCLTEGCAWCEREPAHWKGYAPALVWLTDPQTGRTTWKTYVFEITEQIRDLAERDDLVGIVLLFGRKGTKPNGPLWYEPAPAHQQPKDKPTVAAFDVEPIVEKLYDVAGRHLRPTLPFPVTGAPGPQLGDIAGGAG